MKKSAASFVKNTLLTIAFVVSSVNVHATIVQFQTSLGTFEVNLYDNATPVTVNNFLSYIASDSYNDVVFHRSVPGFVLQGGGFTIDEQLRPQEISTQSPIQNEPEFSNVRGTIAMAKIGGNPNSATSQWFFNLSNNSQALDAQNGGFTVFGQVLGDGMDIIDAIAQLPRPRIINDPAFGETPLQDVTNQTTELTRDNYIFVNSITVLDASADTAISLEKPVNTLLGQGSGESSGGGGTSLFWLVLLGGCCFIRRFIALKPVQNI